ncbi:Lrp/AsnC family transcriptional regulator [Candidatus Woesearchaeota archaeon]|nr:Lrp/AsnC family transcriptional regulator [Candidatus Woesearchaeota archaeon]
MKNLDDKDYRLLNILKENAKLTTKQIAKKTGMPITTIHNRIKKLERTGIIEKYSVVMSHNLLGDVMAYVLVSVMYHLPSGVVTDQAALAKKVRENEFVEEASIIAGRSDLLVKVRTKTVDELNEFVIKFLRSIPGIERTETLVVLQSV